MLVIALVQAFLTHSRLRVAAQAHSGCQEPSAIDLGGDGTLGDEW